MPGFGAEVEVRDVDVRWRLGGGGGSSELGRGAVAVGNRGAGLRGR